MAKTFEKLKLFLEYLKFLKPVILFIFRWLRKAIPYVITGTIAGSSAWYASQQKPAEIPPQKASPHVSSSRIGNTRRIIIEKKQIIEQKIDYAKIQAMIDKAIKEHEDQYHK